MIFIEHISPPMPTDYGNNRLILERLSYTKWDYIPRLFFYTFDVPKYQFSLFDVQHCLCLRIHESIPIAKWEEHIGDIYYNKYAHKFKDIKLEDRDKIIFYLQLNDAVIALNDFNDFEDEGNE
jgi:hypothetical protein